MLKIKPKIAQETVPCNQTEELSDITVDKVISVNDIRARILRIPKVMAQLIPPNAQKAIVCFNGLPAKELNLDKTRTFFGGVSVFYKQFGLILEDGSYVATKVVWKYKDNKFIVILE